MACLCVMLLVLGSMELFLVIKSGWWRRRGWASNDNVYKIQPTRNLGYNEMRKESLSKKVWGLHLHLSPRSIVSYVLRYREEGKANDFWVWADN